MRCTTPFIMRRLPSGSCWSLWFSRRFLYIFGYFIESKINSKMNSSSWHVGIRFGSFFSWLELARRVFWLSNRGWIAYWWLLALLACSIRYGPSNAGNSFLLPTIRCLCSNSYGVSSLKTKSPGCNITLMLDFVSTLEYLLRMRSTASLREVWTNLQWLSKLYLPLE